jgi:SAM-dependent methyltransferase
MVMMPPDMPQQTNAYYRAKLLEHGATARGVDWNSEEAQRLRFDQLLRICDGTLPFSINDFGCGYGALVTTLFERAWSFDYRGFDMVEPMIQAARALHGQHPNCVFVTEQDALEPADYTVSSGVFHLKLAAPAAAWQNHVLQALGVIRGLSRRAFAFNLLTTYSDADRMRDHLFYADPCFFFDYCKRTFSRQVALLHDYGAYEFTVLVRL